MRGNVDCSSPKSGDFGYNQPPKSGDFGYGISLRRFGLVVSCCLLVSPVTMAQDNAETIETPRWQFVEGQTHRWRLTQRVNASQQLEAGAETSYQLDLTLLARWDVQQVDQQGAATIRQTIEQIQLAVDGPGEQAMQYDSSDEASPRGFAARMAPLAKVLLDEPLAAVVLPTGELQEATLPDALTQQLRVAPGAKNLANLTGAESLEQLVQQISLILPEQDALAVGDAWDQSSQVDAPAIGSLRSEKTFRLIELRDAEGQQLAVFQPTVRLVAAEEAEAEGLQVEFRDQETTGEILFNRTAGRLEKASITHAFVAEYKVGERTSTQTIEQTIETTWRDAEAE